MDKPNAEVEAVSMVGGWTATDAECDRPLGKCELNKTFGSQRNGVCSK